MPLAPLHQPNNLAPIRSIRARRPGLPQVACFDTAFHRGHPELADRYAIPERALRATGVRRYGFHGLSYEYIASRLPEVAPAIADGRVVVAHLGSGARPAPWSAGGASRAPWASRRWTGCRWARGPASSTPASCSTSLPSGGMAPADIERLLYHDCGLKGLSGVSNDVRDLLASEDPRARLALDYFVYRIALAFGSLAAAMGGVDGIVFTAGVGENAAPVRAAIAERCAWLGVELDPARNARGAPLHHHRREPAAGLRHPDRRGADDRPPHAAGAAAHADGRRPPVP